MTGSPYRMKRSPAKSIGWILKGGAWVYRGAKTLGKKILGKSSKTKKKSDSISAMAYDWLYTSKSKRK